MKNSNVKRLCVGGLLIALVCIATMIVKIPVAYTEGYIHFGDSVIIIAAVMFGKRYGLIAGGIGSALADIISGYSHWALFTLVIKGLMGFAAGCAADYKNESSNFFSVRNISAAVVCEAVMLLGYFICGILLKGYFMVPDAAELGTLTPFDYGIAQAAASFMENLVQAAGGIIIFGILGFALHKAKIARFIK